MASWGLVCLKAGCFKTAREKFQLCLKPIENHQNFNFSILFHPEAQITQKQISEIEPVKRPTQSPGLLTEILNVLESQTTFNFMHSPKNRVSALTKLVKDKEVAEPLETAYNIVSRLENLRNISQGLFYDTSQERKMYREARNLDTVSKVFLYENQSFVSRHHEEMLFYLYQYASHIDIIDFFIRNFQIVAALRYALLQKMDPEVFIQNIYYPCLRKKNVVIIFEYMAKVDDTLMVWKEYILQLCHHLERKSNWAELYEIQILTRDPVRASMTCIKFYTLGAKNYTDLQNNSQHLKNAQQHLEEEFELATHWEDIKVKQKPEGMSLVLKRGVKSIKNFLNTIARQSEVARFLASCEKEGHIIVQSIPQICESKTMTLPTLFEGSQEKIILSVLVIIHAKNVEAGFGISYR